MSVSKMGEQSPFFPLNGGGSFGSGHSLMSTLANPIRNLFLELVSVVSEVAPNA